MNMTVSGIDLQALLLEDGRTAEAVLTQLVSLTHDGHIEDLRDVSARVEAFSQSLLQDSPSRESWRRYRAGQLNILARNLGEIIRRRDGLKP
jgi:hypothetical protein